MNANVRYFLLVTPRKNRNRIVLCHSTYGAYSDVTYWCQCCSVGMLSELALVPVPSTQCEHSFLPLLMCTFAWSTMLHILPVYMFTGSIYLCLSSCNSPGFYTLSLNSLSGSICDFVSDLTLFIKSALSYCRQLSSAANSSYFRP